MCDTTTLLNSRSALALEALPLLNKVHVLTAVADAASCVANKLLLKREQALEVVLQRCDAHTALLLNIASKLIRAPIVLRIGELLLGETSAVIDHRAG